MEDKCLKDKGCSGFSFTADATQGDGCLKKCGATEFGGYGTGTHDYWVPGMNFCASHKKIVVG
jgi:hypothetical protein